jgi:hypothetical protein
MLPKAKASVIIVLLQAPFKAILKITREDNVMSFIEIVLLSALILLIIGITRTVIMKTKNKEAVALLVDELAEITDELKCIKNGNKTTTMAHREELIRREHEIVRTLRLKYPNTTNHQYDNYAYKYDD